MSKQVVISFSDLLRDAKVVMSLVATLIIVGIFIGQMYSLGDRVASNTDKIHQNEDLITEIRGHIIEQKVDMEYIKKGIDELKKN